MAASIRGVAVWLRTKKRSLRTSKRWSRIASQRISAFVPCGMNHSGGSGLTIGPGAWPQAAGAVAQRLPSASAGAPAAARASSSRRDRHFSTMSVEIIGVQTGARRSHLGMVRPAQ